MLYVTSHPGQLSLLPSVGWETSTGGQTGNAVQLGSKAVGGRENSVIPR